MVLIKNPHQAIKQLIKKHNLTKFLNLNFFFGCSIYLLFSQKKPN